VATAADISWRGPAGTFNLTESGHRFRWVPVRELGSAGFQPAGLIPVLPDLTDAVQRVVLAAP